MWSGQHTNANVLRLFWLEWKSIFWLRKRLFFSLLFATLCLGAGWLFWRLPAYESSIKILLTKGHSAAAYSQANSSQEANRIQASELQAEIELLQTPDLLTAAHQQLVADTGKQTPSSTAPALQIMAVENAPVIQVVYRAQAPEQAAQTLNTLFQQYSAYRQELHAPAQPAAILRAQSVALNQRVASADDELEKLSLPETAVADNLQQQIFALQKQTDAAQIERQELIRRAELLRTQIAAQPEQIETASVTKYAQVLDKLKEELRALEMQQTQLQQKYQPQHRLLRDHAQRLAQVKELIAQEEKNPPRERSFAVNETRQRLQDELLRAEADLTALDQRVQQLGNLRQTYQTQFVALQTQNQQKSALVREQKANEDAMRLFAQKAHEAEINTVLQQAADVQVHLLSAAQVNPRPVNIHWARDLVGLFLIGLSFSLGGTILAESVNPRLRNAIGLQRRLGLPVLARLPAPSTHER